MTRPLICIALGVFSLLLGPATARAQRCPFNMQAQVQVQIQWQRQMQSQSQMARQQMMQQQQRMAMQRSTQMAMQRQNQMAMQRRMQPMIQQRTMTTMNRSITRIPTFPMRTFTRVTTFRPPARMTGISRCGNASRFSMQRTPMRQTTCNMRQLTRINTQRTQTLRRSITPMQTRRPAPPPRQFSQQRTATLQRQQPRAVERRTTTVRETHRPTVQLRVRMTGTCGSCHQCTQNRPTMVNLPNRLPFQIGVNQPLLDRPWLPRNPAPMVRLPGPNLRPQVPIVPPIQRFIVQQPRPVLQAPMLPPLGITRISTSPKPTESLLRDKPTRTEEPIESTPTQPRGTPDATPPLPTLEGGVVRLSPLLTTPSTERTRVRPTPAPSLDPSSVTSAPTLPALTSHRLQPGVQPALESAAAPPTDDSLAPLVELVHRAPPLPPLPGVN